LSLTKQEYEVFLPAMRQAFAHNKLAIAAFILGLVLGYAVCNYSGQRFIIKDAPGGYHSVGFAAYKVDTRTGETWFLCGSTETRVSPSSVNNATKGKVAQ